MDFVIRHLDEADFIIGIFEINRWIAATTTSPYLCFEGDSESAVVAKLRGAREFVARTLEEFQTRRRETSHLRLDVVKKVSAKELELV